MAEHTFASDGVLSPATARRIVRISEECRLLILKIASISENITRENQFFALSRLFFLCSQLAVIAKSLTPAEPPKEQKE